MIFLIDIHNTRIEKKQIKRIIIKMYNNNPKTDKLLFKVNKLFKFKFHSYSYSALTHSSSFIQS